MEAVVLFEYESTQDDELSLQVGEVIHNVVEVDDGWCEGELRGKKGMFPDNFVQMRPATSSAPAPVHQPPPPSVDTPTTSVPLRGIESSKKIRRAKVTFSYAADNSDELTLEPGQVVEVLEEEEEGWWRGRIGNFEGVFPSNFVEEITEEEPPKSQPAQLPAPDLPPPADPHPGDKGPANGEVDGGFKPPAASSGVRGLRVMPAFDPLSARSKLKKATVGPPLEKPPEHKKAAHPPTPSQPAKPDKPVEQAKVTFDYDADNADELTIRVGEVVDIVKKDIEDQEGWWEVSLRGKVGFIPDNFVELLPVQAPPPQPSPPQPKKPPPPQVSKEPAPAPAKQPVHPPPAAKPLKKTEPKKPPAHTPAPAPAKEEEQSGEFPVPKTVPLDTSAVKDRPKHPKNRPPSRSNLLANHEPEAPPEESTAVEEPPAPASASDSKILSPWQAELIAKKKQPKLAPKPAAGKPKPSPASRPDTGPNPVPRSRLNTAGREREVGKPDPPPVARNRINTGGTKPEPPAAAKPPLSAKAEPPAPVKHTPAPRPAAVKPAQPIKPAETKPHPPSDTPSQSEPPTATSPVPATDNAWKEAYEKLRDEFEKFKEQVTRQLDILTEDLDKERKHRAGLDIDIDRLKRAQRH